MLWAQNDTTGVWHPLRDFDLLDEKLAGYRFMVNPICAQTKWFKVNWMTSNPPTGARVCKHCLREARFIVAVAEGRAA